MRCVYLNEIEKVSPGSFLRDGKGAYYLKMFNHIKGGIDYHVTEVSSGRLVPYTDMMHPVKELSILQMATEIWDLDLSNEEGGEEYAVVAEDIMGWLIDNEFVCQQDGSWVDEDGIAYSGSIFSYAGKGNPPGWFPQALICRKQE